MAQSVLVTDDPYFQSLMVDSLWRISETNLMSNAMLMFEDYPNIARAFAAIDRKKYTAVLK